MSTVTTATETIEPLNVPCPWKGDHSDDGMCSVVVHFTNEVICACETHARVFATHRATAWMVESADWIHPDGTVDCLRCDSPAPHHFDNCEL